MDSQPFGDVHYELFLPQTVTGSTILTIVGVIAHDYIYDEEYLHDQSSGRSIGQVSRNATHNLVVTPTFQDGRPIGRVKTDKQYRQLAVSPCVWVNGYRRSLRQPKPDLNVITEFGRNLMIQFERLFTQ